MRRVIVTVLSCVTVVFGLGTGNALGQSISEPFHFTDNVQLNLAGWMTGSAPGYLHIIGANISPAGFPTLAKATQGTKRVALYFLPFTLSPNLYAARAIYFDDSLTGSWQITATRDSESAGRVSTPAIANPQEVPLVKNLRVVGTGLTPQLMWDLPDLTDFDVDRIRIVVLVDRPIAIGLDLRDRIFVSEDLASNTTTFTMPTGVLEFGRTYMFKVMLEDLEGTVLENRSSTFTQPFSPVG